MSYNADYTREYFAIMESLQGDVPGRRAAYEYLQGSTAIVHHRWWPPASCPACSTHRRTAS